MKQDFYWDFVLNIKSNKELIKFIEKNKKDFSDYDWLMVTKSDYFNFNMIDSYSENLDWQYLCTFYKLTEDILEKYSWFLDWYSVSAFQDLSLNFIKKYEDKLSFNKLVSNEFITNSAKLQTVRTMYEERVNNLAYRKIWEENFNRSMFRPRDKKIIPDKEYIVKEQYTEESLSKLSKSELKDILKKLNIRTYYHDTLDILKQKILSN